MKPNKIALSALSAAALAFAFSACDKNAAVNNAAANAANKSNTAVVVNSNQTTVNKTAPGSNAASNSAANTAVSKTPVSTPAADKSEADKVEGELQVGKTESVILYVGMESGDYAGYCFANDSEAGRAILAGCKDKQQCEVSGKIDYEAKCKVPGLEADLSASGRILKADSVKSLGRQK